MKKNLSVGKKGAAVLLLFLSAAFFVGCGGSSEDDSPEIISVTKKIPGNGRYIQSLSLGKTRTISAEVSCGDGEVYVYLLDFSNYTKYCKDEPFDCYPALSTQDYCYYYGYYYYYPTDEFSGSGSYPAGDYYFIIENSSSLAISVTIHLVKE